VRSLRQFYVLAQTILFTSTFPGHRDLVLNRRAAVVSRCRWPFLPPCLASVSMIPAIFFPNMKTILLKSIRLLFSLHVHEAPLGALYPRARVGLPFGVCLPCCSSVAISTCEARVEWYRHHSFNATSTSPHSQRTRCRQESRYLMK
jgi:hypothetical protein